MHSLLHTASASYNLAGTRCWETLAGAGRSTPRSANLDCSLLETNCPSGPQHVQPGGTLIPRGRDSITLQTHLPSSLPAQAQWPLAPCNHPSPLSDAGALPSLSSAHPGRDGGGACASGRPRRRAGLGGPTLRPDKSSGTETRQSCEAGLQAYRTSELKLDTGGR